MSKTKEEELIQAIGEPAVRLLAQKALDWWSADSDKEARAINGEIASQYGQDSAEHTVFQHLAILRQWGLWGTVEQALSLVIGEPAPLPLAPEVLVTVQATAVIMPAADRIVLRGRPTGEECAVIIGDGSVVSAWPTRIQIDQSFFYLRCIYHKNGAQEAMYERRR